MRIHPLGRTLAAAVIAVGSVLTTPALAGSSPISESVSEVGRQLPQLPVVGADLDCDVGGQADFGMKNGVFTGVYAASYRHCVSPNGSASEYSSWLATAAPVAVTGCPQTKFTGSAHLIWISRDDLTLEDGTADYVVTLDLVAKQATLSITVTSGPLLGDTINSVAALSTDAGTVNCGGALPGIQRVFIDGGVEFDHH